MSICGIFNVFLSLLDYMSIVESLFSAIKESSLKLISVEVNLKFPWPEDFDTDIIERATRPEYQSRKEIDRQVCEIRISIIF